MLQVAQSLDATFSTIQAIVCSCCKNKQTNRIEDLIRKFTSSFVDLDRFSEQGLQNLHRISVLYYENLPMFIVNVLVATKKIELGGLMDDSPLIIYLGLATTILNIIVSFLIVAIDKGASDVSFL